MTAASARPIERSRDTVGDVAPVRKRAPRAVSRLPDTAPPKTRTESLRAETQRAARDYVRREVEEGFRLRTDGKRTRLPFDRLIRGEQGESAEALAARWGHHLDRFAAFGPAHGRDRVAPDEREATDAARHHFEAIRRVLEDAWKALPPKHACKGEQRTLRDVLVAMNAPALLARHPKRGGVRLLPSERDSRAELRLFVEEVRAAGVDAPDAAFLARVAIIAGHWPATGSTPARVIAVMRRALKQTIGRAST